MRRRFQSGSFSLRPGNVPFPATASSVMVGFASTRREV